MSSSDFSQLAIGLTPRKDNCYSICTVERNYLRHYPVRKATNLIMQLIRKKLEENLGLQRIQTRDLRDTDALLTELWSYTLGASSVKLKN